MEARVARIKGIASWVCVLQSKFIWLVAGCKLMNLKCHKCESNNTVLVPKHSLEKAVGPGLLVGSQGIIDPSIIIEAIAAVVGVVFAYLRHKRGEQSDLICICKDCGYWERL